MRANKGVKITLSMILTLAFVFSIFGYAKAQPIKLPYKIGVLGSITGVFAALGEPMVEGVKVWTEEINRRGGINGHRVELIILDDASDESKAVLAAKRLIEVEKVHVLNSGIVTGINLVVIPIAMATECPSIGCSGTPAPDRPAKKWYFRPGVSDLEGLVGLDRIFGKIGVKRVACLSQAGPFGEALMTITPGWLEEHGFELMARETYNQGETDMTPQLSKIAKAKPDALLIYGAELGGGLAIKQAREMGLKFYIWIPSTLIAPAIMKVVGKYYEMDPPVGIACTRGTVWDQLPEDAPDKAALRECARLYNQSEYGQKQGQPVASPFSAGCKVMQVMEDSIKRSNADSDPAKLNEARAVIRDALEQTKNLVTAYGKFTMTPENHHGLHYATGLIPVYFKGGKPIAMLDIVSTSYDSKPPKLWYPWEWETPTKPKEPRAR